MAKRKEHEKSDPLAASQTPEIIPDASRSVQPASPPATYPTPAPIDNDFWRRSFPAFLLALVAFSLLTKIAGLNEPSGEVYDEVYYAFTSALMAKGDPIAYSWYAQAPQGYAYEWTHPPLGKLIMAAGIKVFGDSAFGWRISSAIFGTLITLLTTLLALELFRSPRIALLSGYFTCLEGLLFVHSRTAMIDAHVIVFILASAYFYTRWVHDPRKEMANLVALGLCLGLAAATKWNSVFVVLLIGPDLVYRWLVSKQLPSRNWTAWFAALLVILPASIYILAHAQFFALGYSLKGFTELQRTMWWYHSTLTETHSYASTIWDWLANIKPVWMYRGEAGGKARLIYDIGNHVILYSGLVAIALSIRRLKREWSWELWIPVLAYFALFVPWCMSPRIKFFYHYAPSIPFLCILLAHALHLSTRDRVEGPKVRTSLAVPTSMAAALLWFCVLYPFMTGLPVGRTLVNLFDLIVKNP